jgi:large subunit ribosomal protein L17
MRHKIKGRKLNRTASHKKALIRNLANQLFEHKEIKTTTAKAKEAQSKVERLISYAKKGQLHHRRLAFSFLRQKSTIKTLFDEIAPVYTDRQGGYTRVIKLGRRQGDGAFMSILQLVGFETLGETVKAEKKKKTKKKEQIPTDKKAEPEKTEEKTDKAADTKLEDTGAEDKKEAKPENKEENTGPVETKDDKTE